MGMKVAKRVAEQETHEQLLEARAEAERLSKELHELKMEQTHDQGQG